MSKSIKRPVFYKVFLEQFSSETLQIPPSFCHNLINNKSRVVYLTGPSGNTWKMDLIKTPEGGLFFGGGWRTFWKDHSIETGHFLVFKLDGELNFKVKIYDTTCCEKKSAFAAKPSTTTDLMKLKEEEEAVYVQPISTQHPNY